MSVHNIMYQSLAQNPGYYTDWWTPFATSWLDQKFHPSRHTCTHNIHLCLQALGGLPDSGFPCNWGSGQLVQSLGGLFGCSLLPGEVVAPPFSTAHYYILLVFVPSRDNLEFMETAVPEGSKDKAEWKCWKCEQEHSSSRIRKAFFAVVVHLFTKIYAWIADWCFISKYIKSRFVLWEKLISGYFLCWWSAKVIQS